MFCIFPVCLSVESKVLLVTPCPLLSLGEKKAVGRDRKPELWWGIHRASSGIGMVNIKGFKTK